MRRTSKFELQSNMAQGRPILTVLPRRSASVVPVAPATDEDPALQVSNAVAVKEIESERTVSKSSKLSLWRRFGGSGKTRSNKIKKRVRFQDGFRVFKQDPQNSEVETAELWYSSQDYEAFQAARKQLAALLWNRRSGNALFKAYQLCEATASKGGAFARALTETPNHGHRRGSSVAFSDNTVGLEHHSSSNLFQAIHERRRGVVRAVLRTQLAHREALQLCQKSPNSVDRNELARQLAQSSEALSRTDSLFAQEIALQQAATHSS